MSYKQATKNDVKKLAKQIETLAVEVQTQVSNGNDPMPAANELANNTFTLVFTLGEVYALEQSGLNTLTQAVQSMAARKTTAATPARITANYHNVRDSRGRFVRA